MSGGISSVYILDQKGRVIITRDYRDDIPVTVIEKFNQKLIEFADEANLKPMFFDEGITFFHTRFNNLIFLVVTKNNVNATMVFAFMYKLVEVLTEYFKELEEESVRDNFVVIYELLDEMIDNGYPQTTEVKILKEFIKTESYELTLSSSKRFDDIKLPSAISGAVSWRPEGIKYKKNEIYMDVEEKVNMVVAHNGNVIKSEVLGSIKAKSYLSGMPELKLGLNDKALMELQGKATKGKSVDLSDVKFHQCVRLSKFDNERVISFIPPDGEFELISYRLDIALRPLFMVEVFVDLRSMTKMEFQVKAKANFKDKCVANDVSIYIPVPCDAQNPVFKPNSGTVKYFPDKDAMLWTLKEFPGRKEYLMSAVLTLPTVKSPDRDNFAKVPIEITYEIPYFTVSGLQVRYLKIEDKSGYQGYPWVRYITSNGEYQIRMGL